MSPPDASTKLRLVLDYLPCEACLAQPVDDQDLLCSICARLDRQIAVRVAQRTTILLEKPSPPPEPVVIPAAPAPLAEPAPPAPLPEVVVRFANEARPERAGVVDVVVEPLAPAAPPPVAAPIPADAEVAVEPEGREFAFDDIVEFTKARDEFFEYKPATPPARAAPPPAPEPEPAPARAPAPAEIPQDDFVFRPPTREEPAPAPVERPIEEEIIPQEEVPVEAPPEAQERWAPPPDFLAEEAREAEEVVDLEPIVETEPVAEEEPIVEMEVLPEEEPVVEMEVLPEEAQAEPAPVAAAAGDLHRLRGFDALAASALAKARITEISHLSGHDASELQARTGLPMSKLQAWVQVADLVQEVGVPVDAAVALVAAGVAGPKGLRDADPDEVADRVAAFGGATVNARDVKRWKRRA